MNRRPDWLARLTATIEEWRGKPFAYGSRDCGRFGAQCVEAMTGQRFDTPYTNRRQALKLICAGGGVATLITGCLGEPSTASVPQRGDVCLLETEDGEGIGISCGPEVAALSEDGVAFYPVSDVRAHWRV